MKFIAILASTLAIEFSLIWFLLVPHMNIPAVICYTFAAHIALFWVFMEWTARAPLMDEEGNYVNERKPDNDND